MSSILDALNKLEQEKAQTELDEEPEREVDPQQAARELIGGSGQTRTLHLTPAALLVGGLIFMGAMIAISVGVTLALIGRRPAAAPPVTSANIAVAEPAAVADPVEELPGETTAPVPDPVAEPVSREAEPAERTRPVASAREQAKPVASTPEPSIAESKVAVAIDTPGVPETTGPEPAPAVAAPPQARQIAMDPPADPAPEPETRPATIIEPEPEPAAVPKPVVVARREPVVQPKSQREPDPVVTDIRKLPPLTLSIEQRFGADPVLINMISPASANRPYAYAIINRIKVTVGDYIGGSRLRLVQVENHGIAVEAGGDRYYVAF